MRVVVTGAKGQLGRDVVPELEKRGHTVIGADKEEMDITLPEEVKSFLKESQAEAVIHCAAYTAVDAAEEEEALCRKINAEGTEHLAKACHELQMKLLYLSTDYVFSGEGEKPWKPEEKQNPVNAYGQTKYEGELAVQKWLNQYFIVRISWLFGQNGKNFISTMLRLGKEKGTVSVVSDQVGSPTYTLDLARLLADMIETERYGIYHASNEGFCSWYEFAAEIFKQAGMQVMVTPVTSEEFLTKAKRPKNSRLDKEKLIEENFIRLPAWQDALSRYLKALNAQKGAE